MADDEWRFSVDEVGPDDPEEGDVAETGSVESDAAEDEQWVTVVGEDDDAPTVGVATGDPDEEGNVAGALEPETSVEAGMPNLESVVFVTAGVIVTMLVFAAVFVPLDPVTVGAIASTVAGGAAVLYVVFRQFSG
jgi:hypothetical protein